MLIGQFAGGVISIHALREEGDASPVLQMMFTWTFLSTPSARRATDLVRDRMRVLTISIHALREEGDTSRRMPPPRPWYFYPRPPRGGRLQAWCAARPH